ncbi:MAG: type II secretion system protein [Clostridia bacterium]
MNKPTKANKKGFTMIELIGAMIIIAVLTVAGITAVTTAINNSRMTAAQEDLAGFRTVLETFCMENPQYAKGVNTAPATIDAVMTDLNANYLEGEMKFNGVVEKGARGGVVTLNRRDPWGTPYQLHINLDDLDADGNATAVDSMMRFVVVSAGKNTTTTGQGPSEAAIATGAMSTDGNDDLAEVTQYANGAVASCFMGTKENATMESTDAAFKDLIGTFMQSTGKWGKPASGGGGSGGK